MNKTLPTCARCSTSFWPNSRLSPNPSTHFCDNCANESSGVALSADDSFEEPQSYQSYQSYQSTNRPAIEVIRRVPSHSAAIPLRIQPRQIPGIPQHQSPRPLPALPQTLSFNCPACMALLSVARDLAIAGTTAPCPHCRSQVIPPRIAPAVAKNLAPESRWRPER